MKAKILLTASILLLVFIQPATGQSAKPDYPGQPEPGKLFWGSSIQANGDPVARHENPSGETLALRRTFWRWDQRTGNMINTALGDIANGRLPWVSVKPPVDGNNRWQRIADGEFDSQLDQMLLALDNVGGPVWLTMHHEPENEHHRNPGEFGQAPEHVAMNRKVRHRMTELGTANIALAPVFMAWTFQAPSGRNPDDWWDDDIYDFLGIDIYRDNENGSLLTTGSAIGGGPVWPFIRKWAEEREVDVAVGEWGMRGTNETAGQRVLDWYEAAVSSHDDNGGARVVGLSAFDSGLNSPSGSWELKGAQLEMFQQLLGDPRTASINQSPVGIKHEQQRPGEVTLHQNYPNPFNPTTVISFHLPAGSDIRVEVFDVLGHTIATLAEGYRSAGFHTLKFNATHLPSGIYMYRIQDGNFFQTKQMMLIK
ncbi:hypothetical protein BH23BAC3_BH23BAC3_32440 [soil metagenome]